MTEQVFSDSELADIIDLRYDVLENAPIEKFHDAQCEGLMSATKFCNFAADGASLCAKAHSKKWWDFVACMYSVADPNGDDDHDTKNPLAHTETFDGQLETCAQKLPDYSATDLKACAHGSEGVALRKVSAAKTPDDKFAGPVWAEVAGAVVQRPDGPASPRGPWIQKIVKAVCDAYTGQKPKACAQAGVVV